MGAMQLWWPSVIPVDLAMLWLSGCVDWRCRARGGNQTGIHTHHHDSSLSSLSLSHLYVCRISKLDHVEASIGKVDLQCGLVLVRGPGVRGPPVWAGGGRGGGAGRNPPARPARPALRHETVRGVLRPATKYVSVDLLVVASLKYQMLTGLPRMAAVASGD